MQFKLNNDDLARLTHFFPSLKFDRQEQIQALLHSDTGDFQAAPGSGKTTLLGAKLALMAARWPYGRRGICILTHTNVARAEIESAVQTIPQGQRLLAYPHFIGTIQSFVNRFIALPWLRGQGVEVREIDDEAFEQRFLALVRADRSVHYWIAQSPYQRTSAIQGVRYRGASLDIVTSANISLPASGKVIDHIRNVKTTMMRDGRVRHEDMYAFAEQALEQVPGLKASLEYRFPNVFIDEMQDTSDTQLDVLTKVFAGGAVVQRFGDVNQSILSRKTSVSTAAFPAKNCFEVNTSLRFGSDIAAVVNSVKAVGGAIAGQGHTCAAPPTLLLYSAETVANVVNWFGIWLAQLVTQEDLKRDPVKAVCAIKRPGNDKQPIGRHIRDYFPNYSDSVGNLISSKQTVRELLSSAANPLVGTTEKRCAAAREAILAILTVFGTDYTKTAKTWRDLTRQLLNDTGRLARVRSIVLDIVKGEFDVSTEAQAVSAIKRILVELGDLTIDDDGARVLPSSWSVSNATHGKTQGDVTNRIRVRAGAIEVPIHLATIASVKGETHLATLVLESCHDRKYDLQSVLPYLCADLNAASVTDEDTKRQLMNVFVGASRPRKLLAFAMHEDRADASSIAKLLARGWNVWDWSKSAVIQLRGGGSINLAPLVKVDLIETT